jgi:Putative 2OG-Fe(II) oxygenase
MSMDKLEEFHYFSSPVYSVKKPEFLAPIRQVTKRLLDQSKARHKSQNPMTVMTTNFALEPEAAEFAQYVSQTAWNILESQGYAMDNLVTFFQEMWTQEHNFHSSMDQHIHGHGAQISAFYFLEVPEKSCRMVIYDPRPAKVIISLNQKDDEKVTPAGNQIVFTPEVGSIIFTPAWLPHSFTRNLNKTKPVHFVHMNLSVTQAPVQESNVEVI